MKPIKFKEVSNMVAESQDEYLTLPANIAEDGVMTFCWKLTLWERMKLLFTGKLWHQVMTIPNNLQPQLLTINKPHMDEL